MRFYNNFSDFEKTVIEDFKEIISGVPGYSGQDNNTKKFNHDIGERAGDIFREKIENLNAFDRWAILVGGKNRNDVDSYIKIHSQFENYDELCGLRGEYFELEMVANELKNSPTRIHSYDNQVKRAVSYSEKIIS